MDKANRVYIGKTIVNLRDAISSTKQSIHNTSPFEYALMDGFGVRDGRNDESNSYKTKLNSLTEHLVTKYNFTRMDIEECVDEYKYVGFGEMFDLMKQCTIKDEIDNIA